MRCIEKIVNMYEYRKNDADAGDCFVFTLAEQGVFRRFFAAETQPQE